MRLRKPAVKDLGENVRQAVSGKSAPAPVSAAGDGLACRFLLILEVVYYILATKRKFRWTMGDHSPVIVPVSWKDPHARR